MLRIEFSGEELSRLRTADGPDPLWETALSLHLLQRRQVPLAYEGWKREVTTALRRAGLARAAGALTRLCPHASYFPDFLTPTSGRSGFESGLDLVLSTPRARLTAELERLHQGAHGRPPPGARLLAEGDTEALQRLGHALRRYYAVAVRPYLPVISAAAAADRSYRAEAVLSEGPAGMLRGRDNGRVPAWRTEGSTLFAPYPFERELRLEGRSLTLVPSFFCVQKPVAFADPSLPPVLVYPLTPAPGWLSPSARAEGDPRDGADRTVREKEAGSGGSGGPVAQLIGASRAQLLDTLDRPMTTSELAAALRLALSTASRHTTVLREAGLISSRRRGSAVLHSRTPLGEALLNGSTALNGPTTLSGPTALNGPTTLNGPTAAW